MITIINSNNNNNTNNNNNGERKEGRGEPAKSEIEETVGAPTDMGGKRPP